MNVNDVQRAKCLTIRNQQKYFLANEISACKGIAGAKTKLPHLGIDEDGLLKVSGRLV